MHVPGLVMECNSPGHWFDGMQIQELDERTKSKDEDKSASHAAEAAAYGMMGPGMGLPQLAATAYNPQHQGKAVTFLLPQWRSSVLIRHPQVTVWEATWEWVWAWVTVWVWVAVETCTPWGVDRACINYFLGYPYSR